MKSVLVYCGARPGNNKIYAETAHELGQLLAKNHYRLIFGGGNVGLMGVLSNAVMDSGGVAVGVMPDSLRKREISNDRITELIIVENMQERKAKMEYMADFIVALPGGYGSMDELFESLTNAQLNLHHKPVILLNINGYYELLIALLDKMESEGFLAPENRAKLNVANTLQEVMSLLQLAV